MHFYWHSSCLFIGEAKPLSELQFAGGYGEVKASVRILSARLARCIIRNTQRFRGIPLEILFSEQIFCDRQSAHTISDRGRKAAEEYRLDFPSQESGVSQEN